LNGLSGVLGGEETERLEAVVKDVGGDAGASFSVLGVGLSFGGKSNRQIRREVRLRATIHSQVERFLKALEDRRGLVDVGDGLEDLTDGMLVRFPARLHSLGGEQWPLIAASAPTLLDRIFGWDPVAQAQGDRVRAFGNRLRIVGVVEALNSDRVQPIGPVAVELRPESMLVDHANELARTATIVGQVDWKAGDNELLVKRAAPEADSLFVVQDEEAVVTPSTIGDQATQAAPRTAPPKFPHLYKRRKVKKARELAEARGSLVSLAPNRSDQDEPLTWNSTPVTLGVRPLLIFR
jgi:hypothetical protein